MSNYIQVQPTDVTGTAISQDHKTDKNITNRTKKISPCHQYLFLSPMPPFIRIHPVTEVVVVTAPFCVFLCPKRLVSWYYRRLLSWRQWNRSYWPSLVIEPVEPFRIYQQPSTQPSPARVGPAPKLRSHPASGTPNVAGLGPSITFCYCNNSGWSS